MSAGEPNLAAKASWNTCKFVATHSSDLVGMVKIGGFQGLLEVSL